MDNTAIALIQETAAAVTVQECLDAKADHSAVIVPNGYTLKSIEKFNVEKDRFSGSYATLSETDFVTYCTEHKAQAVFVDGETFRAVAYFDLGTPLTPGHAAHQAVLTLKKSAAYCALLDFASRRMAQQEAAETLEDWALHLTASDADDVVVPMAQTIMAVRNVTIESRSSANHKKENLSEGRSLLESIGASSEHTLPANLFFSCSPHLGTKAEQFKLRVSVTLYEGKLFFMFRQADSDLIVEAMAADFAQKLVAALGATSKVYLGTFAA